MKWSPFRARSASPAHGRLNADPLTKASPQKKFKLPSDVRDGLDDLLQPYHDQLREKMLSEMPLEEREAIEEEKRRLDNEI